MSVVLVCGGRDFDDAGLLNDTLTAFDIERSRIDTLIHGDARGADKLAALWGLRNGRKVAPVPADWDAHGKAAGPIRNRTMLRMNPDYVIAFPGGRGTADMVEIAREAGITVIEVDAPSLDRDGKPKGGGTGR